MSCCIFYRNFVSKQYIIIELKEVRSKDCIKARDPETKTRFDDLIWLNWTLVLFYKTKKEFINTKASSETVDNSYNELHNIRI